MYKFIFCFCIWLYGIGNAQAATLSDERYDKYFAVDLGQDLPTYEELQAYYNDEHTVYNRKYDWHWNIGNLFDAVFRMTINEYGRTEKRIKSANEESLLLALKQIPPEYYQYIGPFLHTVPTISDKILNMPGIKETKNKFPTRIAPQLADIEDLEFLSPYLYFLLMPEVWQGNQLPLEHPQKQKKQVHAAHNHQLYDKIKQIVPADEFYADAKVKTAFDMKDLRTIEITAETPLTSGDIKSFLATLPELNKIQSDTAAMAKIYGAGSLLDVWENDHGVGLPVNSFKDLIYPCSRLVQKMRIAGYEPYLRHIVAGEGFTPEQWAYTCDKTIRAYRMTTLSHATAMSLKAYALGVYDDDIREMVGDEAAEIQFLSIQGALRMHETTRSDVLSAYKNRKLLRESFSQAGYSIITAPIAISN